MKHYWRLNAFEEELLQIKEVSAIGTESRIQFSEQTITQMTSAVAQAAMLSEFEKIEEAINEVYKKLNQLEISYTDEIMNKKQTCEYLQISPNTLSAWIRKGLKVTMVDQTFRIRKTDIHEFMEDNLYMK